jgi:hypothetical protein
MKRDARQKDVFFTVGICEKDFIFGGHLFSFSALLISLKLIKTDRSHQESEKVLSLMIY